MTALLALLALLLAAPVAAHDRSASYSTWELVGDGARVTARLPALEATRLPWAPGEAALGDYLAHRLRLQAGDAWCMVVETPRVRPAPPGQVALAWRVACPAAAPLRLASDAFLEAAPAHLHFARVVWPDGRTAERVLSDGERVFSLTPRAPSTLGAMRLGVAHILSGPDHLAFVLALLLAGGSLWETARLVSGFTVAHSLTLALAALGWVRPSAAPVEALIALSIALVAAENCWLAGGRSAAFPWGVAALLLALAGVAAAGWGWGPALVLAGLALFAGCHLRQLARSARPLGPRWRAAFAFGLLHGFGFASALVDAELPPARLVRALAGFNAGVEAGQLAVVALVLPVVARLAAWRPVALEAASAGLAGLGLFWFVARASG
jgi:hypothetical protein